MKEGTRYCKNNSCRVIDVYQGKFRNEAWVVCVQTYLLQAGVQTYPLSPYILKYL